MTTTFLRLLKDDDKEAALSATLASLRAGSPDPAKIFPLDPARFSDVPNSPFAYWVDDEIRELFTKFPPFESEGRTVRVGLQTGDDFRFVRAWWEVPAERRLDVGNGPDWHDDLPSLQAWCRKRTRESKYWAPFAKGGEYSPYYADIHLVVNWQDEGEEMRSFPGSVIRNADFYFRPGVTWPLRTRAFCPQVMNCGTIFSVRGYSFFSLVKEQYSDFCLASCSIFDSLFKMFLGWTCRPEFIVGILQLIPHPRELIQANVLSALMFEYERIKRTEALNEESCWYGIIPIANASIYCKHAIEDDVQGLFGLSDKSLNSLYVAQDVNYITEDDTPDSTNTYSSGYLLGYCFGRFDVRIAHCPSLVPNLPDPFDPLPVCPPAMLIGIDGLPARPDNIASEAWLRARPNAITLPPEPIRSQKITAAEYPLDIPWDGILVDDPDDPRDIVARLRAALHYLHGAAAEGKERELCAELEVKELRDYLRKPSLFFDAHLKRYSKSRRKAPIYWPLSTRDGRYTIWLYYPRLSADTLYACSNILEGKLSHERKKLELARRELEAGEGRARRAEAEAMADFVAALAELKAEIERVAALPYKPDLDDGVQITASPLWRLFRLPSWQKELKATWDSLEAGDYDWAHLANTIWPERVRHKCRKDRSLAIAHGLESICEEKAPELKAAGKKRGRKAKAAEPDLDEELDLEE